MSGLKVWPGTRYLTNTSETPIVVVEIFIEGL